jgi:trimeric autotransporter adhesin
MRHSHGIDTVASETGCYDRSVRCCWLVALLGCGRLGFEPLSSRTTDGGADTLDAATLQRIAYIKASNTETFDDFGYSIALSADGTTLAVGAPQEDSASVTDQTDNNASTAGAVYIYVRSGTTWTQQAYLKAANIGAGDLFGAAVALSADGNTVVATAIGEDSARVGVNTVPDEGAPQSGAAYIFVRAGTTWSQQAYLKASNTDPGDNFGQAAAISASGDVVAISADFESSSASGVNGNQANNMAPRSGAVYVFARTGTTWLQDEYIKASNTQSDDGFGFSVALSADGATLVVGATNEDSGSTSQTDESQPEAGAAYVFVRGATWTQQAYLKSSFPFTGDFFARRVSLSATGDGLLCSGAGEDSIISNSGTAYVASRSGTTWSPVVQLKASNAGDNDQFGIDVALAGDGNTLVVGAAYEDSNAAGLGGNQADDSSMDSGAFYAFERADTMWTQATYGKPPVPSQGDNFGFAVAISGDGRTRAASMPNEDSIATGIDGNAADESAPESGAVIVTYY